MEDNKALRMKDGQPVRYLVVDDSIFARKNLGRILGMFEGVVTGEAATGVAETLKGTVQVRDVSMQEEVYRRKGLAASVAISGDIEGRVIFDLDRDAVLAVARALTGDETDPSEQFAGETVCELANMVVGNAITLLNNQGFRFKVFLPELHTA